MYAIFSFFPSRPPRAEPTRRAQGELEVLRHRLEALSREKESVAVGASARVEELEAKVLEGELQRRKMHNLIQVRRCCSGRVLQGKGDGGKKTGEEENKETAASSAGKGEERGRWSGRAARAWVDRHIQEGNFENCDSRAAECAC